MASRGTARHGWHGSGGGVITVARITPLTYTRVYTSRTARRSHLLDPMKSPNAAQPAACGRVPSFGSWMGTGSQAEHEHARDLAPCKDCLAATPTGAWTLARPFAGEAASRG